METEILKSSCCSSETIPPDLEAAKNSGSLWRAYACYICKKCGQPCEVVKSEAYLQQQIKETESILGKIKIYQDQYEITLRKIEDYLANENLQKLHNLKQQ